MAMSKKDKTQLIALGVIIGVIFVAVIINYRDRFLPKPAGSGEDFAVSARPGILVDIDSEFFSRPDFAGLRHYGEINIIPPDTAGASYVLPKADEETVDLRNTTPLTDDIIEDTP